MGERDARDRRHEFANDFEQTAAARVPKEETGLDPSKISEGDSDEDALRDDVIEVIKTCYDPEIPVNIYELGLIYLVDVDADKNVIVNMTLTSPMCPVAGTLPPEVETKIKGVPGVKSAKVTVVWEPQWSMEKMSEAAKLQLGML